MAGLAVKGPPGEATLLPKGLNLGNRAVLSGPIPLVCRELRKPAAQPTALVHEAYLRPAAEILSVDEALGRLAALDPRQAQMVEPRYFAAPATEETAPAIGVSAGLRAGLSRKAKA
jgi:hypothetical protein